MKNLLQLKPDQWILVGVLIAVGLLLTGKAFLGESSQENIPQPKGKAPSKLLMEQYEKIGQKWEAPLTLTMKEHKVFVPRLIVFSPKSGNIEWLDPEKEMDDGIKASWKLKYGFSLEDPNLKDQDPDNDGFNIMEEYIANTDPTDPKSRPSILVKLRMVQYTKVPFRVQFKAANKLSDGSLRFQLNLLDVDQKKTRFVTTGEEVEGYKIGEYRENIVKRTRGGVEVTVNESELDLLNTKLNETVTLIFNKDIDSDESRVKFKIDVPDAKLIPDEVKRGDSFKLKYRLEGKESEMDFQLLKGSADGATIKDLKTDEKLEIGVQK